LNLTLRALDIGPGDEVITVSFTLSATLDAIADTGATPVLVDVDPETYTLDVAQLESAVSPRTRTLLPVHIYGHPADMDPILSFAAQRNLPVVLDACEAHGASYRGQQAASLGTASCFSFYPTKNLGGIGDGGLVACLDEELAERVRLLRFHGSRDKRDFQYVGTNSRLDELQAAALRLFLEHLDGWNAQRREAAARYAELGLGELVDLPVEDGAHVYHLYVVRSAERDRIAAALTEAEIGNASYYVTPLHLQHALRYLGWTEGSLPETELAARENLALPMWAGIDAEMQERVVATVRGAVKVGVAS
jgi:dTDP-4-amino-4,6-dideoxygalactose transaminase